MSQDHSIGVVLRAYNNELVTVQLINLLKTGMIDKIVVVTDAVKDKDHYTPNATARTVKNFGDTKTETSVISLDNYSWSNALNAGTDTLLKDPKIDRIWCLSNEVDFKGVEGLTALLEASNTKGASCGYSLYEGREEFNYLLPRNTNTLWKASELKKIVAINGEAFDRATDHTGGMEDVLTSIRLHTTTQITGEISIPILSQIPAKIIVPCGAKFAKKMADEQDSLDAIYKKFPKETVEKYLSYITLQARVTSAQYRPNIVGDAIAFAFVHLPQEPEHRSCAFKVQAQTAQP